MHTSVTAGDWVSLDASLRVGIQRTLRVPDDGGKYPLPPSLGRLSVHSAADYPTLVPQASCEPDHFLVPIHLQDAAWIQFDGLLTDPRAVAIAVGSIDAITGYPRSRGLEASPQNYVVVPYQPWLDGFKVATVSYVSLWPFASTAVRASNINSRDATKAGSQWRVFCRNLACSTTRPCRASPRSRRASSRWARAAESRSVSIPIHLDREHGKPRQTASSTCTSSTQVNSRASRESPCRRLRSARTHIRASACLGSKCTDSARAELPATTNLSNIKSVGEIESPSATSRPAVEAEQPLPKNVRPIPPRSGRKR